MRLTKKTHYGIQLLTFLATHPDRWYSLSDIADDLAIPLSFLKHVALALKQSRILDSAGGIKGGYRLARPPAQLTLAAIFKSLDEPISLVPCRTRHCTHKSCVTGFFWEGVTKNLRDAFERSTLDMVVRAHPDLQTFSSPSQT